MDLQRVRFFLSAAVLVLVVGWANQSAGSAPTTSTPPAARFHWSGMQRVSVDANATRFMTIWDLPESRRLEQQTLDKLSLAPWRLLHRDVDTNAAALLRPLLDDVVADESYLQVRSITGRPGELYFAIQLDDRRAALWQTNLAAVLQSLTGIQPVPAPQGAYGWSLKKHHAPNLVELTRVGGWTVVGAAEYFNGSLAELRARSQRNLPPWYSRKGGDWLEADLSPAQLSAYLSLFTADGEIPSLAGAGEGARRAVEGSRDGNKSGGQGEVGSTKAFSLNRLYLAVSSEGTNVLTRATADFLQPLALDLKPWNIPTNLIGQHVCSFTVVRGLKPWLASSSIWTNLQIGPPPDQICLWALKDLGMQTYFAAPLPGASNEMSRLTGWVLQNQQQWFRTNDMARFVKSEIYNGLEWKGVPLISPFVRPISLGNQNFVFGGGMPSSGADPSGLILLPTVLNHTNLVYHDWEITGLRIEQWLYMGQFIRLVSHRAQLPFASPTLLLVKAIEPKLGSSITDITQTGPNQLSLTRRSDIGFTAIELHLLADWLESPQFPIGLHTFLAPPPPL